MTYVNVIFIIAIILLIVFLLRSQKRNEAMNRELLDLINLREAALDIANRVLHKDSMDQQFQYILDTCMRLIPKSKYGSVLMMDDDGKLRGMASSGLDPEAMASFRLPVEESFLYIASSGKMDKTMIINRLGDIVLEKNKIDSKEEEAFVLRSEVSSPLFIEGEMVGMLCIDGDENDLFTEKDVHILDYMSRQISGVIKKQSLYQEVLYLSKKDTMTGLMNRNTFDCDALTVIREAKFDDFDLFLTVFDVDGLKEVNDTYGHSTGDQLIRTIAGGFKRIFSEGEMCARYGGDEFISISTGLSEDEIRSKVDGLGRHFSKTPLLYEGKYIYPSFSFGIASIKEVNYDFDSGYKLADDRMYKQKREKRRKGKINES